MNKVPVRVDGRFRLGEVLGSGSYAVMYSARNIINDDHVALKLETVVEHSSSLEHEYWILKQLEGGVGIPRTLWFSRESAYHALVLETPWAIAPPTLPHEQLKIQPSQRCESRSPLSRLEYIHSHNYVHRHQTSQHLGWSWKSEAHPFIIDFGITKMYWNTTTSDMCHFRHGQSLSGTPVFALINNHLGVEPGRCDDLESLTYMLIYFLRGSLPWLTSDDKKLSNSTILERKARATIADICHDIPVEFPTFLFTPALSHSQKILITITSVQYFTVFVPHCLHQLRACWILANLTVLPYLYHLMVLPYLPLYHLTSAVWPSNVTMSVKGSAQIDSCVTPA
ncbi:kinase-like domain-containing protein [Suillus ampliporus]|nr:kinase-like domain-containing protein [Suillus ampliporus]